VPGPWDNGRRHFGTGSEPQGLLLARRQLHPALLREPGLVLHEPGLVLHEPGLVLHEPGLVLRESRAIWVKCHTNIPRTACRHALVPLIGPVLP